MRKLALGTLVRITDECPWEHMRGEVGIVVAVGNPEWESATQTVEPKGDKIEQCIYYLSCPMKLENVGIRMERSAILPEWCLQEISAAEYEEGMEVKMPDIREMMEALKDKLPEVMKKVIGCDGDCDHCEPETRERLHRKAEEKVKGKKDDFSIDDFPGYGKGKLN